MSSLRANATLAQAAAYLDAYRRKVVQAFNKHGSFVSISRIRGPVYSCHEEALEKAAAVEDPQVRVYVIMGVIEEIAQGRIMAECGFLWNSDGLFKRLKDGLLDLAAKVQEGTCAMPATWLEENVYGPIQSGKLSYVTGDGGTNFMGEKLGDWDAMLTEAKAAFEKKLSDTQLAEAAKREAGKEVAKAEEAAEAARKALEVAKKKVEVEEKKVAAAEKKAATARDKLQCLEAPAAVRKRPAAAATRMNNKQQRA